MAAEDAEKAEKAPDEQYGVAEDLDPIDVDEETNAVEDTDELTYEVD